MKKREKKKEEKKIKMKRNMIKTEFYSKLQTKVSYFN